MSSRETAHLLATKTGLELLQAARDGAREVGGMPGLIGMKVLEVEPGRIKLSAVPESRHNNPLGTIHGGFTATLLDSAMGCALHAMLPAGVGYTTLEFKMNFIRSLNAGSGQVIGEGKVVHAGKTIAIAEGSLFDADGKLAATASTTCIIIQPRGQ